MTLESINRHLAHLISTQAKVQDRQRNLPSPMDVLNQTNRGQDAAVVEDELEGENVGSDPSVSGSITLTVDTG